MVRSLRVFYWVVTERLIIRSDFLSGFNFIFFIFLFIFIFIVILKKFKTKTPETFRAASGISTYRSGKPPPGTARGGGVDQNWSGQSPESDARARTRRLKLLRVGFTRRRFPGAWRRVRWLLGGCFRRLFRLVEMHVHQTCFGRRRTGKGCSGLDVFRVILGLIDFVGFGPLMPKETKFN